MPLSHINGIPIANIATINGVAKASIASYNGIALPTGGGGPATQGPFALGTATDASDNGTPWSDLSLLVAGTGDAVGNGNGGPFNTLKATNFGFSIPTGATIDGITVKVTRKCDYNNTWMGEDSVTDLTISIIKGGTIGSENKNLAEAWNQTYTEKTYGGPTDKWSETWTPSDINSTNFGFAFGGFGRYIDGDQNGYVQSITITVDYTE